MNIQQEINRLRTRLAELEKQVRRRKITGRYIPKSLEEYYYVDSLGVIIKDVNSQQNMDNYRISVGNCFKTQKEAEKYRRILINTQKLKDLAERLNNSEKVDWNNHKQLKFFIYLHDNSIIQDWFVNDAFQGTIHCLDENFLNKAIEEIGEEELIELIKG